MVLIDYYLALTSPFTYLAGDRLEVIAARHGAQIRYRPIDIMVVFAGTGGIPVGKRHSSRIDYRAQDLQRGARKAGLPFNLAPAHWPSDPSEASATVIAVAEMGGDAGALARHFLQDCWARERDVADPATIADGLASLGLNSADIASALPGARESYAANTRMAIDAGVFGAPFYVVAGEKFWGRDRLADLDQHLLELNAGG